MNVRFTENDHRDDKHLGLGKGMEAREVVVWSGGQSVGQCATAGFCPSWTNCLHGFYPFSYDKGGAPGLGKGCKGRTRCVYQLLFTSNSFISAKTWCTRRERGREGAGQMKVAEATAIAGQKFRQILSSTANCPSVAGASCSWMYVGTRLLPQVTNRFFLLEGCNTRFDGLNVVRDGGHVFCERGGDGVEERFV